MFSFLSLGQYIYYDMNLIIFKNYISQIVGNLLDFQIVVGDFGQNLSKMTELTKKLNSQDF